MSGSKETRRLRIAGSCFFTISGVLLAFSQLLAPEFQLYIAIAWTLTAVAWWFSSALGAGLSLGPVLLSLYPLARVLIAHPTELFDGWSGWGVQWLILASQAGGVTLVLLGFRVAGTKKSWSGAVVSVLLMAALFPLDKFVLERQEVETVMVHWAIDGNVPWKRQWQSSPGSHCMGCDSVVLYRAFGDGYCLDAMVAPALRDRLAALPPGGEVPLVYSRFTRFGKPYMSRDESLNGIPLNKPGGILVYNGSNGFFSRSSSTGPAVFHAPSCDP